MNLLSNRANVFFWLFTIAIVVFLVVPKLIQDGMFMDATQYSAVAKNLGNDIGSFWNPEYTSTWDREGRGTFHEQPPLVFYLLSLFFKLFGNGMYTERIYVMLTTAISCYLIHRIWKIIPHKSDALRSMSWLPVLIWITFPLVMWTHQQMLCENTMELFGLAAVYFGCRALFRNNWLLVSVILSGVCVFLATLSKGVPGLFTIVTIPLFWIVFRPVSLKTAFGWSLIVIAMVPALYLSITIFNAEAAEALSFYVNKRLLLRIEDDPVVTDRFQVMKELLMHLAVVVGLIAVSFGILKLSKLRVESLNTKAVLAFLLLGTAGSLPLTFTLVQRGFYLSPAMPFFALSGALVLASVWKPMVDFLNRSRTAGLVLALVASLSLVAAIVFSTSQVGGYSRDRVWLEAIHDLQRFTEPGTSIAGSPEVVKGEAWRAYLMRYPGLTLVSVPEAEYYISVDGTDSPFKGEGQPVGSYFLFKRRGQPTP